jgi:hypothetical protein
MSIRRLLFGSVVALALNPVAAIAQQLYTTTDLSDFISCAYGDWDLVGVALNIKGDVAAFAMIAIL